MHAPVFDNQGNEVDVRKCPFCRTPHPKSRENETERFNERVEANDAIAIYSLACDYRDGMNGYPQDHTKALELWHRSAELGDARAYCNIGVSYQQGRGVEVDTKKAVHYFELAAMEGYVNARFNLGNHEGRAGNMHRALKHYMISARDGYAQSLEAIQKMYSNGYASKEDYTKALQLYQAYLGEIKSKQRDEAAAADEKYRYY